jgi:hypothetical protein
MCESVKHSTDVPLIQDPDEELVHKCEAPQGGTKTVGIPQYVLTVENQPDPNAGS